MSHSSSDRNLLFGILAIQMEFVSRDQLIAAMHQWMRDKGTPLGEILVRQEVLTEKRRVLLDELVQEHIEDHGSDAEQSVAAACRREPSWRAFSSDFLRDLWNSSFGQDGDGPAERSGPAFPPPAAGGRFQVLRLHAEGGLGQVMLATDAELGRTVAVKEMQPKYARDPGSRSRFVQEAEITAGLEHPGIVPVYGCGAYPDGRPYYAMRFIQGFNFDEAIDRFHQEQSVRLAPGEWTVALRRLLRRFTDVCQAVEYAHSRGVVHRDIKPANVMLGKYGETLVVDWGLAKVVGRSAAVRDAGETTLQLSVGSGSDVSLPASVVGTPAYMSPEQASGKHAELGPACDVYSLGATLYRLLTGKPPFADSDRQVLLEKVRRGDFPRPRQVKSEIPAPLEAICLKAMSLSAQDRYQLPVQLVEEIEHWMADEPVAAYAESRRERLVRWLRRHRNWVRAGIFSLTATILVLSLAMILVTRAYRREAAALAEARDRFGQAQDAVDKWLTGAGYELGYYPGGQHARQRLLEQAVADYELLAQRRSDDLGLEVERGRTYLRLGRIRQLLHDTRGAQRAYGSAQSLFQDLAEAHPGNLDCQVELANCHANSGVVLMEAGEVSQADQAYQQAISHLEAVTRKHSDADSPQAALATVLVNRGELLTETGRPDEAERSLRRGIRSVEGSAPRTGGRVARNRAARTSRDSQRSAAFARFGADDRQRARHPRPGLAAPRPVRGRRRFDWRCHPAFGVSDRL